ncbi:iron chelate uptake ABC transporter family permease subunit [Cobetia sp. L2A1]|uniref:iron chelate uptake ABC transporter family permease subunit n=1 Tax=Cobetia sp. L2A1 TaxID=2686360 RepID=UPI00131BE9B9|nr:iron chelate uptake ABC transporter family permease subunit [Cobetia sp. L2A1]
MTVPPIKNSPSILFGAAFIVLIMLAWWSLWAFSTFTLTPADVWAFGQTGQTDDMTSQIIGHIRLPRTLTTILVGALLGMAGLLMQGISRNPLASPTMLGVTGGASLGLALVSSGVLPIAIPFGNTMISVLGGGIAWLIVFVLGAAWSTDASRARLVLAGITVAALCASMTRLVILLAEERSMGVLNWLAGSMVGARWPDVWLLAVAFIGAFLLSIVVAKHLNLMNLGDDSAQSLGVPLNRLRIIIFTGGTIMVGVTVAVVGPIGFIGLMAPNIARRMLGVDYRPLVLASAMCGAILLLLSDIIGRWVAFPSETPAGAVTALIGAPFFLLMARRLR